MSEHTAHSSLLRMGPHSHRPVRVPVRPCPPQKVPNECVSVRTGPWSWYLMNHVLSYEENVCCLSEDHMAAGCIMAKKQASRGSVLICWETLGLGIHLDVTLTHNTYLQIVADHKHPNVCSLIAVASFSSIINPPHCKNCSEMVWGTWQWVQGVALASKFPRHHTEHLWDVLDKHIWSTKAPPHSLQDLMDLLLMFWYQIPHIQRSCEDHASTHQSCFGSLRGTFMILH